MTAHRCELAEALLYSPVQAALQGDDRQALRRVLSMSAHEAVDPDYFTAPERACWPSARCWAGVPTVVASRVWPLYARRCGADLDRVVDRVFREVVRIQLFETRKGVAVFERSAGICLGRRVVSPIESIGTIEVDLSRVWVESGVRGLLLGPLAAWPVTGS